MVDNPDKLRQICLRKFVGILKSDENLWKRQIEERIIQHYFNEKNNQIINSNEQQKRKQHRGESFGQEDGIQITTNQHQTTTHLIPSQNSTFFIEYFLRNHCRLNSNLSEDLVKYLIKHDQFNDFTFAFFTSNFTCLKRFIINTKYISRLQCHILNQHPNLTELEIIFKDSHVNRPLSVTNNDFYQHICPPINSNFEDINSIYAPFIIHRQSLTTNLSDEFSQHKLLNLIFNNLHPITIERLRSLNLSHYKFFTNTQTTPARQYSLTDMSPSNRSLTFTPSIGFIPANVRSLMKFTNLTSLNLSSTDIKNPCLDILTDSLRNLDQLDLSSCYSIKLFHCLLKLSSKLKWLSLYNCILHMQQNPTIFHILYQLKSLEYLDLSNDQALQDPVSITIDYDNEINRFLRQINCLPRLKHFDLSGQKTVSSKSLQKFLQTHRNLQFLGLFLTHETYLSCIMNSNDICYSKYRHYTYDLQSELTEQDFLLYEPCLLESFKHYHERANFVQKILYYCFLLTRTFRWKQQNRLIEYVLHVMSIHSTNQSVQLASTACIYNLTRTPISEQIHVKYLAKIVRAIMNVMDAFPNQQQLQKNCLLTLCSDRILHEPHFDFYSLAVLVMNNLHHYTDLAIIQPGVAILSLLTTRLTIYECTQIGSVINICRLLQLIEEQINRLQTIQNPPGQHDQSSQILNDIDMTLNNAQQLTSDDTLRFCLSLLWNLTDENGRVCECFIESMGLQLFQRLLQLFSTDTILLTKIVGLLSNIAEVSNLRIYLNSIDTISLMRKFMVEAVLDIAFAATGILAHLLSEQNNDIIDWHLCQQMRDTILTWQNPHTTMVTYRSFKPFVSLLQCTRIPVVQLWALWAIHHVCSTDRVRYYRIIQDEKLYEVIETLYENQISSSNTDSYFTHLLKSLRHLLRPSSQRNSHQNSSAVAS